jgi:hypothetical protein
MRLTAKTFIYVIKMAQNGIRDFGANSQQTLVKLFLKRKLETVK